MGMITSHKCWIDFFRPFGTLDLLVDGFPAMNGWAIFKVAQRAGRAKLLIAGETALR